MRTLLSLFIMLLLLSGCGESFDNASQDSESAFNISLAPAFAPVSTTPVPVNAQLILHASAALDPATVNESSVYIQNTLRERQDAYITLLGQDILVKPKVYLTAFTDFEIVITTALTNTTGTHLAKTIVIPSAASSAP